MREIKFRVYNKELEIKIKPAQREEGRFYGKGMVDYTNIEFKKENRNK